MIKAMSHYQLSAEKQIISVNNRNEKITIKKVASSDVAKAAAKCL
ncbi:MAG: hypothetical protein VKL20_01945 [Synechocystis sp.]|nr:hypothetical protein [Synechocystis sp.]